MESNFNFIDNQEEFYDISEFLDFDVTEDDLNNSCNSCDTTLSAIEGMDLDLDDFDVDQVLEQLEKDINQVQAEDDLLDIQPLEFVDVEQQQSNMCTVCNLPFTTTSNLKRHFNSKKHQQAITPKPELIQTGPFAFEVQVEQLTLGQMTGLDLNLDEFEFVMAEEEEKFDEISSDSHQELTGNKKRKNQSRATQKCTGRDGKKLFRCAACPKVFTTASNLNRHENLHRERKLHGCKTCGKKFQQKEYLKKHQIVHERK